MLETFRSPISLDGDRNALQERRLCEEGGDSEGSCRLARMELLSTQTASEGVSAHDRRETLGGYRRI